MVSLISREFPNLQLQLVPRSKYMYEEGIRNVETYCSPTTTKSFTFTSNSYFLCISATAALMDYLMKIKKLHFAAQSIVLKFHNAEGHMSMDLNTATQLVRIYCQLYKCIYEHLLLWFQAAC